MTPLETSTSLGVEPRSILPDSVKGSLYALEYLGKTPFLTVGVPYGMLLNHI